MNNKVLWVGGIHGVGKSSSLKHVCSLDPAIECVYLGRLFYERVNELNMSWAELTDPNKLLEIESYVTDQLVSKINKSGIVLDAHFCININGQVYPGFHAHNLKDLFSRSHVRKGLVHLIAHTGIVLKRRSGNTKKFRAYPEISSPEQIVQETLESSKYFNYFEDALSPEVFSTTIDTSSNSIEEVGKELVEVYHAI